MGNVIADIIFAVIGILIILICTKRGFLKTVIHFFKTILAFVAAYFLGSVVGRFICEKWIGTPVRNFVYDKINGIYLKAADAFNAEEVISSMPGFLMTEEVQTKLHAAEGSGADLVNTMTDSIASPVASLFSNIIGYVLVFVVALIALWLAAKILDKLIERITILNTVNKVLGCVLGILIAVSVLFVAASLMKFFFADSPIYAESAVVKFFGESPVLNALKFLNVGQSWFSGLIG